MTLVILGLLFGLFGLVWVMVLDTFARTSKAGGLVRRSQKGPWQLRTAESTRAA